MFSFVLNIPFIFINILLSLISLTNNSWCFPILVNWTVIVFLSTNHSHSFGKWITLSPFNSPLKNTSFCCPSRAPYSNLPPSGLGIKNDFEPACNLPPILKVEVAEPLMFPLAVMCPIVFISFEIKVLLELMFHLQLCVHWMCEYLLLYHQKRYYPLWLYH